VAGVFPSSGACEADEGVADKDSLMAWLQSHQELRSHPKTIKAARLLGVSLPTMVGHLHLLWWWALDHAPDGDLSRFDAEDVAMAAQYEGNADALLTALRECGPGISNGFLTVDKKLHDWSEYGGKYGRRVEQAKKAADARWGRSRTESMAAHPTAKNAHVMLVHSVSNAEERRGEEKREDQERASRKRADRAHRLPDGWTPEPEPDLIGKLNLKPKQVALELERFADYWTAQPGARGRKVSWQATWRNWLRRSVEISGQRNDGPVQPAVRLPTFGTDEWERKHKEDLARYEQLTGRRMQ
jgi:hypothetical protein